MLPIKQIGLVGHPTKGEHIMKRATKVMLLVMALSLVTSACFQIRGSRQSPYSLAVGDRGTVRIEQYQLSDAQGNSDAYPFLLIGFTEADLKLKAVSSFDLWGLYGGPLARESDNALRDLLRTPTNCTFGGIDAADVTGLKWWAYRTSARMDSTSGAMSDNFRTKVAFERVGGDDDDAGEYVIFSGTYAVIADNGIPEAGEVMCFSMIASSFAHKP